MPNIPNDVIVQTAARVAFLDAGCPDTARDVRNITPDEIYARAFGRSMVRVVKAIRTVTDLPLREAKGVYDTWMAVHNVERNNAHTVGWVTYGLLSDADEMADEIGMLLRRAADMAFTCDDEVTGDELESLARQLGVR